MVVGLAWCLVSAAQAGAPDGMPSAAERIEQTPLFLKRIVSVGDRAPAAAESEPLLEAVLRVWQQITNPAVQHVAVTNADAVITTARYTPVDYRPLEEFMAANPDSPWLPSLRANLGRVYEGQGRYTLALEHWERAWTATRNETGCGKPVADYALAHRARLLSRLGRSDALAPVLQEAEARALGGGSLQQRLDAAREAHQLMCERPGIAFQCGPQALHALGLALGRTDFLRPLLTCAPGGQSIALPGSPRGFSLAGLQRLAERYGLGLAIVQRTNGTEIVTPSLMHWRLDHYAAIVARRDDSYRVIDPSFGEPHWMKSDALNAEASGYFLVPDDQIPAGWRAVPSEEAEEICGRGGDNSIQDEKDQHACGLAGYNGEECSTNCTGAARWWVSEPYITLWVEDELLSYQPSRGPRVSFHLSFKQRNTREESDFTLNVGQNWECNWMSYLHVVDYHPPRLTNGMVFGSPTYDATLYLPGGGVQSFSQTKENADPYAEPANYFSQARLVPAYEQVTNVVGFDLVYPDRARDLYRAHYLPVGEVFDAWLAARVDPLGNTTRFDYNIGGLLTQVVDVHGRTNTISYTNINNVSYISRVTDPFVRSCNLYYLAGGYLTNMVDPQGFASAPVYNTMIGRMTDLSGPHGIFTFQPGGTDGTFLGTNGVARSLRVVRAYDNKAVLYLYRDNLQYVPGDPVFDYTSTPLPPAGGSFLGTLENDFLQYRNSFHWGLRQCPTNIQVDSIQGSDYWKARRRHWLHVPNAGSTKYVGSTLSMERSPSPDGQTAGQFTWYDYAGKSSGNNYEGASGLPSVVTWSNPPPANTVYYIWYQRDAFGHPTNVVETWSATAGGPVQPRTNRFVYSTNGVDLLVLSGPSGERLGSWAYNTNHQVTYATNALEEVTTFHYNGLGQIEQVDFPSGLSRVYSYNGPGAYVNWLHTITDNPINRTHSFTYGSGLVSGYTDPRSLGVSLSWDPLQRLTKVTFPESTYLSNRYNGLMLTGRCDRLTNWTTFAYDLQRQLTNITDALSNRTGLTWCSCSGLERIDAPLTNWVSFNYDSAGRLTDVSDTDVAVSYGLDSLGRITSVSGAVYPEAFTYTAHGLLGRAYNATGQVFGAVYDARDRPVWTTNALGVATTNTFDARNRLVRRAWTNGTFETFSYASNGLSSYTDPLGHTTRFVRDAASRLLYLTNANGHTLAFTYNAAGDLLTLRDGNGQFTSWSYDRYGRVTNKFNALGQEVLRLDHDPNGRVINRWTPAKSNTVYGYDAVGNLTNVVYPNGGASNIVLVRDALGQITRMVDAVGTNRFSYRPSGLMLTENGPWTNDTLTLTYMNGLRSSLSLAQPSGSPWTESYSYDGLRRLQGLTSPAGAFAYHYLPSGEPAAVSRLLSQVDLPNGLSRFNQFDGLSQMRATWLSPSGGGSSLSRWDYGYSDRGQRTSATRADAYSRTTRTLGYDPLGQLTSVLAEDDVWGTMPLEQFNYTYDGAQNVATRTKNGLTNQFQVDALNQLTTITRSGTLTVAGYASNGVVSVTVNGQTATVYGDNTFAAPGVPLVDGTNTLTAIARHAIGRKATNTSQVFLPATVNYSYDANGNLLFDGLRSFTYDAENQLTKVLVTNMYRTTWVYDGLGRRRIQKDSMWTTNGWVPTNETRFLYDHWLVIQERDSNNAPRITYTRGVDLSGSRQGAGGIGGLLALTKDTGTDLKHYYYEDDGLGNVTGQWDTNRTNVARYLYDPYGNLISATGSKAGLNRYRYSSKEVHASSGLYYFGFRYYDPGLQRWLTPDPTEEEGGVNLYEFVYNDPIDWMDPDGLAPGPRQGPNTGRPGGRGDGRDLGGRGGRPTPEQLFFEGKEWEARERTWARRVPGHRP
jgi:RHS repeat-associated protein